MNTIYFLTMNNLYSQISINFSWSAECWCWGWRGSSKICWNQLRLESVSSKLGIFQRFWITTTLFPFLSPKTPNHFLAFVFNKIDFFPILVKMRSSLILFIGWPENRISEKKTHHKFHRWVTFDKQNFLFNRFKLDSHFSACNSKNQFRSTF